MDLWMIVLSMTVFVRTLAAFYGRTFDGLYCLIVLVACWPSGVSVCLLPLRCRKKLMLLLLLVYQRCWGAVARVSSGWWGWGLCPQDLLSLGPTCRRGACGTLVCGDVLPTAGSFLPSSCSSLFSLLYSHFILCSLEPLPSCLSSLHLWCSLVTPLHVTHGSTFMSTFLFSYSLSPVHLSALFLSAHPRVTPSHSLMSPVYLSSLSSHITSSLTQFTTDSFINQVTVVSASVYMFTGIYCLDWKFRLLLPVDNVIYWSTISYSFVHKNMVHRDDNNR